MRRRSIGKSAKAFTENSISANTARSSSRREASTTAAETAALIDSTEVSLFFQPGEGGVTCQSTKREKGYAPFALDRNSGVRVIGKRCVHEEERRREG
jgi:hypothetical protein